MHWKLYSIFGKINKKKGIRKKVIENASFDMYVMKNVQKKERDGAKIHAFLYTSVYFALFL